MQQAEKEHSNTLQDEGPQTRWLVGISPRETMNNCADLVEFLGDALDGMQSNGLSWEKSTTNAVALITRTLTDTMRWEAERTAYRRIEPQVEGEAA